MGKEIRLRTLPVCNYTNARNWNGAFGDSFQVWFPTMYEFCLKWLFIVLFNDVISNSDYSTKWLGDSNYKLEKLWETVVFA